jgi:hypothetical protein
MNNYYFKIQISEIFVIIHLVVSLMSHLIFLKASNIQPKKLWCCFLDFRSRADLYGSLLGSDFL